MDQKTSPFQIVLLAIFVVLGLAGIIIFAMTSSGGATEDIGEVKLWGTMRDAQMGGFLHDYGLEDRRTSSIQYSEKDPKSYYDDLARALAAGAGPDIVVTDQAHIQKYSSIFKLIPFTDFPARTFTDAYIDASESLLVNGGQNPGIRGVPFAVDPLVMYWNRDIFSRHAVAQPPRYWNELFQIASSMTERKDNGDIQVSGVALGETTNVNHAKDIIAAMIMQAGGDVIARNDQGKLEVRLQKSDSQSLSPAQSAVRFYTDFANPTSKLYSWNKSLPNSLDMFVNGDLAVYIGTASELKTISEKNPNLNFDIAPLPQVKAAADARLLTTGSIYVLAITKTGQNSTGAMQIAQMFSNAKVGEMLEKIMGIPSSQRALLSPDPKDPLTTTLRAAAIRLKTWYDPDPEKTQDILFRMIDRVTTGEERISESVQRADSELKILIRDSGQ
jgi:multiple sugar transport system substrate-binding protein